MVEVVEVVAVVEVLLVCQSMVRLGGYCCAHAPTSPPEAPTEQDFHCEGGVEGGQG